jgi:hypothetical protein
LRRGKVARPKLRRARGTRRLPRPGRPQLPKDVRFRAATRVKAVGYGTREQAWRLSRGVERRAEKPLRGFWGRRSRSTQVRVGIVAALLLLYAVVKFIPVPGIPCSISAAKECAPSDHTLAMVPADALLYGHLTLDGDTAQFDRLDGLLGRFSPERSAQLGSALLTVPAAAPGVQLSFAADIRPWARDDAAVVTLPGQGGASSSAVIFGVADRKGAEALVNKVAPGPARAAKPGQKIEIRAGGFADAFDGDFLVLGDAAAVRAILAAGEPKAKTLADDPTAGQVRGELSSNRFADLYVSGAGARQLLATSATTATTQLETFVDYGATRGFAIGAVAKDDGIELQLFSALDPALQKAHPSLFTSLPHYIPRLTRDVGGRAIGYIGIGEAGKSLGALLQRAGGAQPGLGASLKAFLASLRQQAKVDPSRDLLPALAGEAALVAEPTDGLPFASLIVDGVDEAKARSALAQLQEPLVRSLAAPGGQPLAGFQSVTLAGGLQASSLRVSPAVNLTYAVFDRKLVISTQPAGVEQVAGGGGQRLADAPSFRQATAALPNELSALVFFNLDQLLDLAEGLGRIEDPLYASFRDDIRKLHAIAVGVDAGAHDLSSRLFVTIK